MVIEVLDGLPGGVEGVFTEGLPSGGRAGQSGEAEEERASVRRSPSDARETHSCLLQVQEP